MKESSNSYFRENLLASQFVSEVKDINSNYWKALVLSLITAEGVIKLEV